MTDKQLKWIAIVALVLAIVTAGVAWYLGHRAGVAAGAAAAAATASKFWAARGRDEEEIVEAEEAATVAIDRLKEVGEDATTVVEDNRAEVAGLSGEDKAKLVDKLTET